MSSDQKQIELLEEIRATLSTIQSKQEVKEQTSEANNSTANSEKRSDDASSNIQTSFNRIHDKLFSLSTILIAAFLGLAKFPIDDPVMSLWLSILPIANLCFLIYLEIKQMEIHRFASHEMTWQDEDRVKYGEKIQGQNKLSLLSIFTTIVILVILLISVLLY
jgi:chromatin remodeling complex protein RSC6